MNRFRLKDAWNQKELYEYKTQKNKTNEILRKSIKNKDINNAIIID